MIDYKVSKCDNSFNPHPVLFVDTDDGRLSVDLVAPYSNHVPYSVDLTASEARGLAQVLIDAADKIDNLATI